MHQSRKEETGCRESSSQGRGKGDLRKQAPLEEDQKEAALQQEQKKTAKKKSVTLAPVLHISTSKCGQGQGAAAKTPKKAWKLAMINSPSSLSKTFDLDNILEVSSHPHPPTPTCPGPRPRLIIQANRFQPFEEVSEPAVFIQQVSCQ
jgi:hypothetical protein